MSDTKTEILKAALDLLVEFGPGGLTMRKVSVKCQKSLGNVQYHYKDKQALFEGMADYYFGECDDLVKRFLKRKEPNEPEKAVYSFVKFCLEDASKRGNGYLVFRELWAISSRDESVRFLLERYYKNLADTVTSYWSGYGRRNAEMAVSLLMPYVEGYALINSCLPSKTKSITEHLSQSIYSVLTLGQN